MEALRKFEGASLDDILEHVYRECGVNATIVEANRIRRGGVGGFFARRKLKKIGAQQASLGWRTIIGKISAAVDWRD